MVSARVEARAAFEMLGIARHQVQLAAIARSAALSLTTAAIATKAFQLVSLADLFQSVEQASHLDKLDRMGVIADEAVMTFHHNLIWKSLSNRQLSEELPDIW